MTAAAAADRGQERKVVLVYRYQLLGYNVDRIYATSYYGYDTIPLCILRFSALTEKHYYYNRQYSRSELSFISWSVQAAKEG